jgi:hypothetical protein
MIACARAGWLALILNLARTSPSSPIFPASLVITQFLSHVESGRPVKGLYWSLESAASSTDGSVSLIYIY